MAEVNLLYIGSILSAALGLLALYLVRKNETLDWNESIAAHILCLMFISKGVQNASAAYYFTASGDEWQFFFQLTNMMEYFFGGAMMMMCLVYPIPFLRTKKHLKIAALVLLGHLSLKVVLNLAGMSPHVLQLPGTLYVAGCLVWGTVYVRFRTLPQEQRTESTRKIALLCGLFLTLIMGHAWMWWPGLLTQADYFFFIDAGGGAFTPTGWDFSLLNGYAFCISIGLVLLVVELYMAINGDRSNLVYIVSTYYVLGAIGYTVLSSKDSAGFFSDAAGLAELWNTLTSSMHFTIIRPIIALYVLMKYNLFDINPTTRPIAKTMAIILIVVATSAILELIQTIIPINQMVSAALLGIIIAFGVGWEERSFNSLVSNPFDIRKGVDERWYPDLDINTKHISRIDGYALVYLLLSLLISYIIWQTGTPMETLIERTEAST